MGDPIYPHTAGIDISVQSYKAGCPPSALTKLPLTTTHETVRFIVVKMEDALRQIQISGKIQLYDSL